MTTGRAPLGAEIDVMLAPVRLGTVLSLGPHRFDAEVFRHRVRFLRRRGFSFVALRDLAIADEGAASAARAIAFVLADVRRTTLTRMLSVLRDAGCPVTVLTSPDAMVPGAWSWPNQVEWLLTRGGREAEVEGTLFVLSRCTPGERNRRIGALEQELGIDIPAHAPETHALLSWDDVRELTGKGVAFAREWISSSADATPVDSTSSSGFGVYGTLVPHDPKQIDPSTLSRIRRLPYPIDTVPPRDVMQALVAPEAVGRIGGSVTDHADRKPHLLILSFHAPPSNAVGGLRWWGLSRHLVQRGWRVTMLVAGPTDPGITAPDGVQVRWIPPRKTSGDWYKEWRNRSPATDETAASSHPRASPWLTLPWSIREELIGLLNLPDITRGWLIRLFTAARHVVVSDTPDVVISSGPPHAVHLLARLVTGKSIAHVVDLRDPIFFYPSMSYGGRLLTGLAHHIVRSAALVIATTPAIAHNLVTRHNRTRAVTLRNGVDLDGLQVQGKADESCQTIVHVGSVYLNRDPTPVIDAFEQLLARDADRFPRLRLLFIGECDRHFKGILDRAAQRPLLYDRIEMKAAVPREEALSILSRASLALVLAQRQGTQVPAKTFESLGMGIPTLVIAEHGSASSEAARLAGALHCDPQDVPNITAVFRRAALGDPELLRPPIVPFSHQDLSELADEMLRAVCR